MSEIRMPYNKRLKLQEELHLTYGKLYMTNIDSMNDVFVEISDDGERTLAYVEFKNDYESIKPFLLKAIKNDCDQLNKPFYLSILHRDPVICYYLIPLNDAARALPHMEVPKFWTEKQYIWLLHHLRGKKVNKSQLEEFCGVLPDPLPPLNPNINNIKELIK
jgi:hypothetical protein